MELYSDSQLILELKNDSHEAFHDIYERYADKLIAIALKKTRDEQEAMDMVQDLFLAIWKNRFTIQINGSLEAYLVVSINYMVYKWYKKQKFHPQSLSSLTVKDERFENSTAQKISFSELEQVINKEIDAMPEKMKQVYLYSRERDMNGLEIATTLNISHQTVRNQISNALSRLKKVVNDYYHSIPHDNIGEFLLLIIFFHFV